MFARNTVTRRLNLILKHLRAGNLCQKWYKTYSQYNYSGIAKITARQSLGLLSRSIIISGYRNLDQGCLNRDAVCAYKRYFAVGERKMGGNSHKTIVLTASKYIGSFYCSQCCHS